MKILENEELAQVSGGIFVISGRPVFSWLEQLAHKLLGIRPLSHINLDVSPAQNGNPPVVTEVDPQFSVTPQP